MNQILISAEGKALLWVIGFPAGTFSSTLNLVHTAAFSVLGAEKRKGKLSYSNPYNGVISRFVKVWGTRFLFAGINGNGDVYGVYKSEYFKEQLDAITGFSTGYIEEDSFANVNKNLFWVASQPSGNIEVTGITIYNGTTYIIGELAEGSTIYPVPYIYKGIAGDAPTAQTYLYTVPVAYPFAYTIPLPLTYPGGASVGCGPKFFAVYSWDKTTAGSGFLNVYDYSTGNILYTWFPTLSQSTILQNMTNRYNQPIPLTVSSKYIAGITQEFSPDNLDIVTSSYLFVWEITKKKLVLVSETQIAGILNPRGVSFDMQAAYEGKV